MDINIIFCDGRDSSVESSMLECIQSSKCIFLDLEGKNLGRNGDICLIQFTSGQECPVFILDVASNPSYLSDLDSPVRKMLESSEWSKWMWDPRADADALFACYGIIMSNTTCIQLAEVAFDRSLGATRRYVHSMVTALKRICDPDYYSLIQEIKEKGRKLFSEEQGGNPDIFYVRPLPTDLCVYSGWDVAMLPTLKSYFHDNLPSLWRSWVYRTSRERLEAARSEDGIPSGSLACLAP